MIRVKRAYLTILKSCNVNLSIYEIVKSTRRESWSRGNCEKGETHEYFPLPTFNRLLPEVYLHGSLLRLGVSSYLHFKYLLKALLKPFPIEIYLFYRCWTYFIYIFHTF